MLIFLSILKSDLSWTFANSLTQCVIIYNCNIWFSNTNHHIFFSILRSYLNSTFASSSKPCGSHTHFFTPNTHPYIRYVNNDGKLNLNFCCLQKHCGPICIKYIIPEHKSLHCLHVEVKLKPNFCGFAKTVWYHIHKNVHFPIFFSILKSNSTFAIDQNHTVSYTPTFLIAQYKSLHLHFHAEIKLKLNFREFSNTVRPHIHKNLYPPIHILAFSLPYWTQIYPLAKPCDRIFTDMLNFSIQIYTLSTPYWNRN